MEERNLSENFNKKCHCIMMKISRKFGGK
jgi:hypothetical protein